MEGKERETKAGRQRQGLDTETHRFIWERYVDELVKTARTEDSWVNNVWSVSCSNNKNIFL
jgi:hypothetical protein